MHQYIIREYYSPIDGTSFAYYHMYGNSTAVKTLYVAWHVVNVSVRATSS